MMLMWRTWSSLWAHGLSFDHCFYFVSSHWLVLLWKHMYRRPHFLISCLDNGKLLCATTHIFVSPVRISRLSSLWESRWIFEIFGALGWQVLLCQRAIWRGPSRRPGLLPSAIPVKSNNILPLNQWGHDLVLVITRIIVIYWLWLQWYLHIIK